VSPRHPTQLHARPSAAIGGDAFSTALFASILSHSNQGHFHRESTPSSLDFFADATLVSPPSGVISFGSSATSSRVPSPIPYHPHTLTAAAAARMSRQQGGRDGTITPNNTSDEDSDDSDDGDHHGRNGRRLSPSQRTLSPRARRVNLYVHVSMVAWPHGFTEKHREWVLVTEQDTLTSLERTQKAMVAQNPVGRWMGTVEPLLIKHDQFCEDMHQLVEVYMKQIRSTGGADTRQINLLFGSVASVHDGAQYLRRVFRESLDSKMDSTKLMDNAVKAVCCLIFMGRALISHP